MKTNSKKTETVETKTKTEKAPDKIRVAGVVYQKLPEKIRVAGKIYELVKTAVKGKGLGTPGGQQPQIPVGQRQTSKGNSKQVPLPDSNQDVAYLRGKK